MLFLSPSDIQRCVRDVEKLRCSPLPFRRPKHDARIDGSDLDVANFTVSAGSALRRARRARRLSLHDVRRLSNGHFKPSTLGGYERGERAITLERFCELASLYGMPADRLLADVCDGIKPERRKGMAIDLTRLPLVNTRERDAVADFLDGVRSQRKSPGNEIITLRSQDVEALAFASHLSPSVLVSRLRPALVERA